MKWAVLIAWYTLCGILGYATSPSSLISFGFVLLLVAIVGLGLCRGLEALEKSERRA